MTRVARLLAVPIAALTAGVTMLASGAVPGLASTPAAHLVGTWANDQDGGTQTSGGYELWSNGKVVPLQGAAGYGDAAGTGQDDFVGMVTDYWATGYWLVTSTGKVYAYGRVCQDQRLVGPKHVPTSGIVGGVDMKGTNIEGFDLVGANGTTYQFQCQ